MIFENDADRKAGLLLRAERIRLRARALIFALLFLPSVGTFGQGTRPAHIGYVFPAGGRQGTTVEVLVGGQALGAGGRRADGTSNLDVLVSGDGLSVKVVKVYQPFRRLEPEQRVELIEKLWDLREKRLAALPNGEQIRQEYIESGRGIGLIPMRILRQNALQGQQRRQQGSPSAKNPEAGSSLSKNQSLNNTVSLRNLARATPPGAPLNSRLDQRQQAPANTATNRADASLDARRELRRKAIANTEAARRTQSQNRPAPAATPRYEVTPTPTPVPPIEHPLVRNMESKSLRQLQEVIDELLIESRRRRQPNTQIAEMVLLVITIGPDATPGPRHIRLSTPTGLTNPMTFYVGTWPEVREQEPNDPGQYPMLPPEPAVSVPFVLNGQIKAGDVDRFKFFAQKGQNLVIQAHARDLMPYLADAVPGWFQATMALYDSKGREVAYADDYRFSPDPVLLYKIPADDEYDLEVRDSLYRGREDFVYRIEVGEKPFITAMYPLGGRQGADAIASVTGWNLTDRKVRFDTRLAGTHEAVMTGKNGRSNQVAYNVGTLPECFESEPNDTPRKAQAVALPLTINGRIDKPGDVDTYRVRAGAGQRIVADVIGRRLESPLDSLVRVLDADGNVIAWNDDHPDKSQGLKTHYADSYVLATLPRAGDYFVEVSDAQRHGGDTYVYRLRLEPPQPDFEVRVTPSSLNFSGRALVLTATAIRRDGFDGDIDIEVKNPGFELSGNRLQRGRDSVRMTIATPQRQQNGTLSLNLEARASIGGKLVSHAVVPCEDMEQAFAYRHLVASRDLVATARGGGRPPFTIAPAGPDPVVIPAGGTAQFRIGVPPRQAQQGFEVELNQPPDGIKIQEMHNLGNGTMVATVKADKSRAGFSDNLIFEVFTEVAQQRRPAARPTPARQVPSPSPAATPATPPTPQKRRVSSGLLPAVPIAVK